MQLSQSTTVIDSSVQNTCIKNPRNSSIVIVPNHQAVAGVIGNKNDVKSTVQHRRQRSTALSAAFIGMETHGQPEG